MDYGLIGYPLGHSYSPEIHGVMGDYPYVLRELKPEELPDFFARRDFCGINVTIPYKQTVMAYPDELSPSAAAIGAVNTVANRNGRLYGDNTDLPGMLALFAHMGIRDLTGKKVIILGTGGTSKTAFHAVKTLGAETVLKVSRERRPDAVSYAAVLTDHRDARILINATPVGMYPHGEQCPMRLDGFDRLEAVVDAVYNPLRTELVLAAQERGIRAEGGLFMLAAQAVYANALFFNKTAETANIDRVFRTVMQKKRNIVLFGMPSSGKTTVGRALARRLDMPFADTDELVLRDIGMPIRDFFERFGEAAFRDAESRVIRQLASETGTVIATGGGAVLRAENVRALKHNGLAVFLDRAPELLTPGGDRPLSSGREQLRALYEQRLPVYRAVADITVANNGHAADAVNTICGELEK